MQGIYAHAHFSDLDLDTRSQWVSGQKFYIELSQ